MAPEMIQEYQSGPFTDLWSLGVIAYQFYVGELPFKGGSYFDVGAQINNGLSANSL